MERGVSGQTSELEDRLIVARKLARQAGRLARGFFRKRDDLVALEKASSQDLVSEADHAVERLLRRGIRRNFPGDGIVGEEHARHAGTSNYTWVIDPIDGTMAFLVGQPNWTVSIAVMRDGEPVAGVVHAPVLRELYEAHQGGGAFLNGQRLAISPDWTISSTTIGFGATERSEADAVGAFVARLYKEGGVLFRVGSGALMLAYVAANRLAGYYDPHIYCWDCFAGMILIREAGGTAAFDGNTETPGPIWAGNARVFADLRRLS